MKTRAAIAQQASAPLSLEIVMEGKITIDDLITHTMPLEEINKAFDLMHADRSIRSVVMYEGGTPT